MKTKPTVLCLFGPTAIGKSALALAFAEQQGAEIINVDSALIYKDMNIGTAKPSQSEQQCVPHHLIDIISPEQRYSVSSFITDAHKLIEQVIDRGNIPLLVGGTMMYFKSLQQGLSSLPAACPDIRANLTRIINEKGAAALYQQLQQLDPEQANKIASSDTQRIQRSIEVCLLTGKTMSELQAKTATPLPYQFINVAMLPEQRQQLHQNIALRLQQMFALGFVEELEALRQYYQLDPGLPSMRTVGYRQIWQYLDGEICEQVMQEKALFATRQLAKRQLTWIRSWQTKLTLSTDCRTCRPQDLVAPLTKAWQSAVKP